MTTKQINGFLAMRYAGVTRSHLRQHDKQGRLLLWMMIVATIEWS